MIRARKGTRSLAIDSSSVGFAHGHRGSSQVCERLTRECCSDSLWCNGALQCLRWKGPSRSLPASLFHTREAQRCSCSWWVVGISDSELIAHSLFLVTPLLAKKISLTYECTKEIMHCGYVCEAGETRRQQYQCLCCENAWIALNPDS